MMAEGIRVSQNPPSVLEGPSEIFTITASVVLYHNEKELPTLLASLEKEAASCRHRFHLYVIDNSEQCVCRHICDQYGFITLIANENNTGFGTAHNQVIPQLSSKYHVVINPDIACTGNVINTLVAFLEMHEDVAMATCEITYPDGTIQKLPKRRPCFKYLVGRRFSFNGKKGYLSKLAAEYCMDESEDEPLSRIEFCTGCFFAVRTAVYQEIEGFDESYFMYFEDADLTQRVLKYGDAVMIRSCHVIHDWKGGSRKSIKLLSHHVRSMFRFMGKYGWR